MSTLRVTYPHILFGSFVHAFFEAIYLYICIGIRDGLFTKKNNYICVFLVLLGAIWAVFSFLSLRSLLGVLAWVFTLIYTDKLKVVTTVGACIDVDDNMTVTP